MDKIKAQADKLWQLLSNPSTGAAYQQTLALTWSILKETGLLLWLIVCLVLVVGDWFWKYSFTAGQNTRIWLHSLQTKSATATNSNDDSGNFWAETRKSLLTAGQNSVNAALNTARDQLGIAAPATPVPKAITPPPASQPTPAPAPEMSPLTVEEPVLNEPKVPPVEPPTSSENSVIIAEEEEQQ